MNRAEKQPSPFTPPGRSHLNPTVPFPNESSIWEVYINEAVVVDNELVKDWTSSLNFLLVFAAIFSSVLSAFIIDSKQMLEQDPATVMVDALIFFINNTANGTHTPYSATSFSPPPFAVSVNCLFFASLSASIIAALASVVALQWVAEYDAVVSRSGSSPQDRVKRRQFRYGGMEKWKMGEIIATLPVLLYCSLVLFFAGLSQWMWNVNTTVGGVVLGGMALGAAFYMVTTLMAVVFPSSPFRAPTVRWIYVLLHLVFHSFIKRRPHSEQNLPTNNSTDNPINNPISNSANNRANDSTNNPIADYKPSKGSFVQNLTGTLSQIWIAATQLDTYQRLITKIPSMFSQVTVQERDQARIEAERKSLVSDSLAWLAQNISISNDSHDRLLLLADEASRLEGSQQTSKKFMEIRWAEIFHLLGTKYARAAALRELKEEDERGLTILLRCLRNPRIGPTIAPEQHEEYQDTGPQIDIVNEEDFNGANSAYILLRNIEYPDIPLSIEEQVKLRVASLNCTRQTLQSAKRLVGLQKYLTCRKREDMWDDIIPILCEDIQNRTHENEQERVDNLISLALLHQPPVQGVPLRLYNGRNNHWQKGEMYLSVTVVQPSMFFYRLSCVNWIKSLVDHPHIHAILGALHSAQSRDPHLQLLWRFVATDEEVDAALRLVQPGYRSSISRFIQYQRQQYDFQETLATLDKLVGNGSDEEELEVIVGLLCNDLKSARSPSYKKSIEDWEKERFESLQNPWLRLIGYALSGNTKRIGPSSMSDPSMPWSIGSSFAGYLLGDQPLADLSILPQLRMRFLRELDREKMKSFMMERLVDVNKLKQLQTEFHQPSLGVDFGGDYLLQVLHSPFSIGDSSYKTQYGRIPDFLVHDNDEASEFIRRYPDKFIRRHSDIRTSIDCISYLLELCREIKRNPGRLTGLLIHMVASNLKYLKEWDNPICVMDLCDILKVMREGGLGKKGSAHIADSYELAGLLRQCRDGVTVRWDKLKDHERFGSLMKQMSGRDDFRVRCNEAIHQLASQSLTTFGLQTRRLVTCARPTVAADAAVGILRMYDN